MSDSYARQLMSVQSLFLSGHVAHNPATLYIGTKEARAYKDTYWDSVLLHGLMVQRVIEKVVFWEGNIPVR